MKRLPIEINDSVFAEMEKILIQVKKPTNQYINEALDHFNKLQRNENLEKRLENESALVKSNSLLVLKILRKMIKHWKNCT